MTADDSIKWWCTCLDITGQKGGFQNPWVCLQVFPFYLRHFWCGLGLLFLVLCSESTLNHLLCRLMYSCLIWPLINIYPKGRAVAHNYSKIYVLKCQGVGCKQSFISLNTRRVLRHGAFGKENTLSQKGSGPLTACAFYPSYFEENKRLLAVYQSVGHKTVKEVWNFGSVVMWKVL